MSGTASAVPLFCEFHTREAWEKYEANVRTMLYNDWWPIDWNDFQNA